MSELDLKLIQNALNYSSSENNWTKETIVGKREMFSSTILFQISEMFCLLSCFLFFKALTLGLGKVTWKMHRFRKIRLHFSA